jgi:hypothetical protein
MLCDDGSRCKAVPLIQVASEASRSRWQRVADKLQCEIISMIKLGAGVRDRFTSAGSIESKKIPTFSVNMLLFSYHRADSLCYA